MLSFRLIPPGVLHLWCVIVARRKWLVDDAADDGAMKVQTNFICSQYFATITIKSKIIIQIILVLVTLYLLLDSIRLDFMSLDLVRSRRRVRGSAFEA